MSILLNTEEKIYKKGSEDITDDSEKMKKLLNEIEEIFDRGNFTTNKIYGKNNIQKYSFKESEKTIEAIETDISDFKIENNNKAYSEDRPDISDNLKELKNSFEKKFKKYMIPEENKKITNHIQKNFIKEFIILKKEENTPIYKICTKKSDLKGTFELFYDRLNDFIDDLKGLINNTTDDNLINNLNSYIKVIEKSKIIYKNQIIVRRNIFKEAETINELQEEIQGLFSLIMEKYIIFVLIDALYERLKNGNSNIYKEVLKKLNKFLQDNGVYTLNIKAGDLMDPECMEATFDSAKNITEDESKYDTISEIRRYPYYFEDEVKIIDGKVKVWRSMD